MTDARIYVACLASYNAGTLYGRWIDATTDVSAMQAEINAMLAASPAWDAEEWAIHDYEGLGDGLGEYAGLEEVARRVAMVEAAEDIGIPAEVLIAAMSDLGADSDDDPADWAQEHYRGEADSWAAFAQDWAEDVYDLSEVPDWLQGHIDWESIGRYFRLSGDFTGIEHGGSLYVFWY